MTHVSDEKQFNTLNVLCIDQNVRSTFARMFCKGQGIDCIFIIVAFFLFHVLRYLIFSSIVSFYGPFFVMIFTYYRVYKAAVEHTRNRKNGLKPLEGSDASNGECGLR